MSNNELRVPQDSIYPSQPLSELDQASSVPICTLGPFPQNTAYNPVDHNVFNLEQDQLLCSLLSLAKAVIQNIASQNKNASSVDVWEWLEQLIEAIFGKKGMRELQSDFKRLDIQYNHACGKLLSHGEIYFRCLDCDESHNTDSNGNVVICSGCFEKSNHKGHRVLMLKSEINSALACSCGISSLLSQKGFCSRHGASHDSVSEILAKLPVGFADRFLKSLKKAFYSVISLFELSERVQDEQGQEMLLALAQLAMEELLLFCTISYAEVNEALMVLLGILFRSPLLDGCNLLWHECNDLAKNDSGSSEPHRCTCSLLGLLFRFSSKLNEELQMKLNKILIDCAKDNDFKPFLCEEFTKYSQYIFFAGNQDCHGEYARSGLVNIQKQLYTSEVLREGVLRAGHFANLVKVMKTTAQDLYQNRNALYDIIESISTILSSFLSKKSGSATKLLTETGLIKDLLEVLYHLQLKTNNRHIIGIGVHEHQVDYGTISWTLKLENIATQALEMSFQLIAEYSEEDKAKLFDEFITSWRNYFGLISQGTQKKPALFNISLERVLVSAIFNHSQEVNENEVKSFFNRICEKSNASSTSEKALEGIVKRLGAIRYLHLIHDYNSASGLESYYGANSLSFEKDILGVQLLSSTLESKNLYEILSRQFFSYEKELQAFLLEDVKALRIDDYLRAKLVVLEDFMNFLVFIMNDQTCIFNLTRAKEEETPYSRDVALRKYEKVVEKVLTNALLGQYWVDITTLKNTLTTTLTETSQLEHIIKKLTVYDSKTRKIRIKDEYKDELDPYVFYKMPALQKEITHVMASKPSGKEKKVDLVSGKFNTEVPSYVKSAQKDLYESSLSGFLASFVSNFNDNLAPMTRPVLKLILTHLQLAVQAIQERSEASVIVKKAAVSYLNQGFSENLASISKLKDLSDCESCIEKIQGLLKTFASKLGHEECEATERESSKEEVAASKKDLVSKRMQQMKEEFMKKQKLFMNKNSHLLGETSSEEKSPLDVNTQQDLVCQHCLEHLNEDSDIYGIPIYIGFTNNMYDTQSEAKFKRDDHPHRLKGDWWPVISSCMHYYHQKCYQTLYINSRASNEQPGNYFSNELETCCSLCKTLCNNFLPVNKVCCKETDMGSSHNEQNRNRHPKLFMSFSEKIDELIKDLRRRLGASPSELTSEENQVSSREIAKRAFSYFLETFYQSQNLQQQEKLYDLYQKFFKVYLSADSNANCSDIDSAISETMITGNINTLIENPLKISNLAPKMIKLPSTYAEFNSAYFKKKCSRCNQFSKNLSTCLCLHCGKIVCLACCHTSESDRDFGNLNKHAKRYHLGSAMFLEIQRLTKTIICSPVNAVFPGEDVYVDEFGQPVQYMIKNDKKSVYTLDFNKFTLNPNFVEYVRNMVSTQGIAKEAFTVSKIYGYYTHDNVL